MRLETKTRCDHPEGGAADRAAIGPDPTFAVSPPKPRPPTLGTDANGPSRAIGVELVGVLCARTVPDVDQVLADLVDDGLEMVLDLSGTTLVSAAALGMFVRLDAELRAGGGRLRLEHPDRLARQVLTACRLGHLVLADPTEPRPPDDGPSAEDGAMTICNLGYGQIIEVTISPDAEPALADDLSRTLVRLVSVRQPDELRVRAPAASPWTSPDTWAGVHSVLGANGGTLTLVPVDRTP